MYNEILGVAGMNLGLAKTRINEAFEAIQNENIFSFQLKTGGWLAPVQLGGSNSSFLSPGTISVKSFDNQITGDAVATAAWASANTPFITQYQFRVPYYSLYNIIAFNTVPYPSSFVLSDTVTGQLYSFSVASGAFQFQLTFQGPAIANPIFIDTILGVYWQLQVTNGSLEYFAVPRNVSAINQYIVTDAVTSSQQAFQFSAGSFENIPSTAPLLGQLTLDRPWMEPSQPPGSGYLCYQAYFPAPAGFKEWYWIVDTTNNNTMDWWSLDAIDLSEQDPQRTDFSQPEYVVPWGIDARPGSATFGQFLFELWEGAVTMLPYNFGCKCNWPALVAPTDTLPFPLTEELVKLRAMEMTALWSESQKGTDMERGSGANWQFLSVAYNKEYLNRLKLCKNMDRNIVDLYFTRMRRTQAQEPFASVGGQMNVGS
jgi:hypothetical protein